MYMMARICKQHLLHGVGEKLARANGNTCMTLISRSISILLYLRGDTGSVTKTSITAGSGSGFCGCVAVASALGRGRAAAAATSTATATKNMMSTTTSSQNEAPPPNVINFSCGHPDARLLPVQQIAEATQNALLPPGRQGGNGGGGSGSGGNDDDTYVDGLPWLQYGRENGNYEARKSIADFISTQIYGWKKFDSDNPRKEEESVQPVVDPDMICITSGVSHGIQLVARTLIRIHNNNNNKVVDQSSSPLHPLEPICFVEDPTYFLVPPILQQSGYNVRPVKTDPMHGLDLTALEQQFELARQRDVHEKETQHDGNRNDNPQSNRLLVLYCIPTHHNPLGVSLSYESRTALVELCSKYNVYLIADEVYLGLSWGSSDDDKAKPIVSTGVVASSSSSSSASLHIVPMLEVSMGSCPSSQHLVISVSAFTKILCPGIRCGWIHTQNQQLLQAIRQEGVLDSGGCTSQLSSGIVRQLILGGQLSTYLTELKMEYSRRCQRLCDALQKVSDNDQYPFKFRFEIPTGGYFLWVSVDGNIPFKLDDDNFRTFCLTEHNVDFKTGTSCSSSSNNDDDDHHQQHPFASYIRLCFAYYDSETLEQGVQRLCRAIHEYSNRKLGS